MDNLQTQVANYLTIRNTVGNGQPAIGSTLFTIWSGGNDVIDLVTDGTAITPQQIADNIGLAIDTLYAAGGRNEIIGGVAYAAVTNAVPEPATTAAGLFVVALVAVRIVRRRRQVA